ATGKLRENQPRLLRRRYTLPVSVADVEDYESRYLIMAILGLADPAVTSIGTANPSTLIRLLAVIHEHADTILRAVAGGRLPDDLAAQLDPEEDPGLKPRPDRAAQLQRVLDTHGRLTYGAVWPRLAGLVTWTGGSCGAALGSVEPLLPESCIVIEAGWVASEMQGTINVDPASNTCVPVLGDTFFEFAEREAWEAGSREMLPVGELETGRDYYVVVTTPDRLYRYDMNDIVRVTGWVGATPALVFVQKGSGTTSITGEKLHESQVLDTVAHVLDDHGLTASFFIMLADVDAASYTLYLEPGGPTAGRAPSPGAGPASEQALAAEIDDRLRSMNIEYDSKRASGRLGALSLRRLQPGTGAQYRRRQVAAGQRDAQFKYLHVQYRHDCAFDFDAFAERD
ncbi:MAG: GH3 auxin-responsive promoter family protein, partial [Acidimicrobiaceae bacterium]|nr:GH3 auxin-responsive promoter family protein [Acidimicrobiaceae bacterium]